MLRPITSIQAYLPPGRMVDLAQWRRWLSSPRGARRLDDWGRRHPALLGWRPPAPRGGRRPERHPLERPVASPATDAMQAALVELAQDHDSEAAVTLLVQLRPGLLRLVGTAGAGRGLALPEAVEEVRAVFFEALYRHRLDRRPAKIAANLILDTRQRLHRSAPRPAAPALVRVPDEPDTDARSGVLAYETLRSVAWSLPGSASSRALTVEVAFRAWVLDHPRDLIARDLGVGPQGIASRLHRLRRAIRNDGTLGLSA